MHFPYFSHLCYLHLCRRDHSSSTSSGGFSCSFTWDVHLALASLEPPCMSPCALLSPLIVIKYLSSSPSWLFSLRAGDKSEKELEEFRLVLPFPTKSSSVLQPEFGGLTRPCQSGGPQVHSDSC